MNSRSTARRRREASCPSLPVSQGGAHGADDRRESGDGHLPGGRRRAEGGEEDAGGETAQKSVQLGEGVEEGAVREEVVDGLVDLAQAEGEEEPGEDAGPGEERA